MRTCLRRLRVCYNAVILASLLSAIPVAAQTAPQIALGSGCKEPFRDYLKKPNPGHFFHVKDAESGKHQCGFSSEDPGEFDRYPSSAQIAYTICQNGAEERGIKARCELIAAGSTIVSRSFCDAQQRARREAGGQPLAPDPMRCVKKHEAAAQALGIQLQLLEVRGPDDFTGAFHTV